MMILYVYYTYVLIMTTFHCCIIHVDYSHALNTHKARNNGMLLWPYICLCSPFVLSKLCIGKFVFASL